MRNYVSKMLVGQGVANVATTDDLDIHSVADGKVAIFDWDAPSDSSVTAATKLIGVVKGGSAGQIIAGPFPKASLKVFRREYSAGRQQKGTLQVTSVPGTDAVGLAVVFKVIYHQNLSIVPNQIKAFTWSVPIDDADAAGSASDFAAKIKAGLDAAIAADSDKMVYFTAAISGDTITFTAKEMESAKEYNEIDRPEQLIFELAATAKVIKGGVVYEDSFSQGSSYDKGEYTLVDQSVTPIMANGTESHVKWMEDQHMGRLGFSDRRMWNDTKKYKYQAQDGATYDYLILSADLPSEGDLQDTMNFPVGCVIASTEATTAVLATDLETVLGSGAVITQ